MRSLAAIERKPLLPRAAKERARTHLDTPFPTEERVCGVPRCQLVRDIISGDACSSSSSPTDVGVTHPSKRDDGLEALLLVNYRQSCRCLIFQGFMHGHRTDVFEAQEGS